MLLNPHTPNERARWLQQFGHAWGNVNLRDIDAGRAAMMDGSEADYRELVRSFQELDANVAAMSGFLHGRELIADGDVGPATNDVMQFRRCSMPDFAPPPGAAFHYDDPELQGAVESYQRFAESGYVGGTGSWPKCDPDRPDVHGVRVCLNDSAASSFQKGILKEVLKMVEETEAEIGQWVRHIINGDPKQAEHDVRFQFISGGVIGFAYFPEPNSCNQTVTARIDNSFDAKATILAELLTHEYKGHSDGLEHTRGGIMNPSIGSPSTRASWKGDPHQATKTRYFGGVAIPVLVPPTPDPGPGPTPTPGDEWAGASVTIHRPGKPPRRFVPAIEV